MKFMQKYRHKGVFYMDEDSVKDKNDVRLRANNEATGHDEFDKSALPAVSAVVPVFPPLWLLPPLRTLLAADASARRRLWETGKDEMDSFNRGRHDVQVSWCVYLRVDV